MNNVVVIMAGGLGKRMKSDLPKVLHKVMDKPMLVHVIERALEIKPIKIYIVVGKYMPIIKDTLYHYDMLDYVEFINQPEALGTGHAIQCCRPYLYQHEYSNTLILSGDVPLIKTETIKNMVKNMEHARIMCTTLENPTGYGRIIEKEGKFEKIVEEKDCNDEERKCRKTNAGIYTFDTITLCKYLPLLSNDNSQGEYYLTDIVEIIKTKEDVEIELYEMPVEKQIELTGVNTKEQLEKLNEELKKMKN
jgi:UDP-N-acetylglucosamine diphosphorylase/glucosamine-1-phosphate N-acetyltransferase